MRACIGLIRMHLQRKIVGGFEELHENRKRAVSGGSRDSKKFVAMMGANVAQCSAIARVIVRRELSQEDPRLPKFRQRARRG